MALAGDVQRRGSPGWAIAVASIGAAVTTSGVQGIAPAIPAIQQQFDLSSAQIALITSIYLFPSMFSAFAGGMLADRIGIRSVFAGALVIFGAGGALLLVEHSLGGLLAIRFVQGAAFGAIMSMSVGIIGTVAPTGSAAARGQSRRSVTLAAAEATLPVVGGLLLGLSWFAPFAVQVLALPIAMLAWWHLPSDPPVRRPGGTSSVRLAVQAPAIVAVQALGGLRFIFKFAVLTYFPVLAVTHLGMSPVVVGFVMGFSAVLTAGTALVTDRLVARWLSSRLLVACLLATGLSLVSMGLAPGVVVLTGALWLFGLQDGIFGVAHNVLVTEMAPGGAQSTYIGLTGTVRNIGKFAAPLVLGAATLVLSLPASFAVLGGASLLTALVARHTERAQVEAAAGTSPRAAQPEDDHPDLDADGVS